MPAKPSFVVALDWGGSPLSCAWVKLYSSFSDACVHIQQGSTQTQKAKYIWYMDHVMELRVSDPIWLLHFLIINRQADYRSLTMHACTHDAGMYVNP